VGQDVFGSWPGEAGSVQGNQTNVQYKAVQKCHNESPLYNEYTLIKMGEKDFLTSWDRHGMSNQGLRDFTFIYPLLFTSIIYTIKSYF
jgi:hypothetical protein